jgi:membrane protein implicated in regulation of membrane protease activity
VRVLSILHSHGTDNAALSSYRLKLLVFIHLVVIGWLYVVVMMAVAEATNTTGTVLGAIFTFLLYGLAPVALVVYLMGTPGRRRAIKEREAQAQEAARRAAAEAATKKPEDSGLPNQRGEAPTDAVAPVRKEP